jgi:hypothetical protein
MEGWSQSCVQDIVDVMRKGFLKAHHAHELPIRILDHLWVMLVERSEHLRVLGAAAGLRAEMSPRIARSLSFAIAGGVQGDAAAAHKPFGVITLQVYLLVPRIRPSTLSVLVISSRCSKSGGFSTFSDLTTTFFAPSFAPPSSAGASPAAAASDEPASSALGKSLILRSASNSVRFANQ